MKYYPRLNIPLTTVSNWYNGQAIGDTNMKQSHIKPKQCPTYDEVSIPFNKLPESFLCEVLNKTPSQLVDRLKYPPIGLYEESLDIGFFIKWLPLEQAFEVEYACAMLFESNQSPRTVTWTARGNKDMSDIIEKSRNIIIDRAWDEAREAKR